MDPSRGSDCLPDGFYEESLSLQHCLQVVFLELCSERRGILTMTKQEV